VIIARRKKRKKSAHLKEPPPPPIPPISLLGREFLREFKHEFKFVLQVVSAALVSDQVKATMALLLAEAIALTLSIKQMESATIVKKIQKNIFMIGVECGLAGLWNGAKRIRCR